MPNEAWRATFPDLPHEPQDLDLVRRHLAWTPAERLRNLRLVHAFVTRGRAAKLGAPIGDTRTNRP
jgi:hypothetical protein